MHPNDNLTHERKSGRGDRRGVFLVGLRSHRRIDLVDLRFFCSGCPIFTSAAPAAWRRRACCPMLCCIISFSALAAMQNLFFADRNGIFSGGPGGLLGALIYNMVLKDSIGVFGSALILGTVYFVGMLFIFTRDIAAEITHLMNSFTEWRQKRAALKAARLDELRQRREAQAAQTKEATVAAALVAGPPAGTSKKMVVPKAQDPLADTPKTASIPPAKPAPEPVVPAKLAPAKTPTDHPDRH